MQSRHCPGIYCCKGTCRDSNDDAQGLEAKLRAASPAESLSMSIPVIWKSAPISLSLWADRRAITPVPVPMSRRALSPGSRVIAAPSRTPSVPTFIADLSFCTVKRLKRNTDIPLENLRNCFDFVNKKIYKKILRRTKINHKDNCF